MRFDKPTPTNAPMAARKWMAAQAAKGGRAGKGKSKSRNPDACRIASLRRWLEVYEVNASKARAVGENELAGLLDAKAHAVAARLEALEKTGKEPSMEVGFMNSDQPLDPHKTILVLKCQGKEVGRIPATAPNASAYLQEMASVYAKREGGMQVDYEPDPTGGLLALLHGRRP